MRLAVSHVDHAAAVHENAVRAGELAGQRIAIRAVAALAGAHYRGDNAAREVDTADGVALGVGDVQAVVRRPGDSLGPVQLGQPGRAAVPGMALFSGSGHVLDAPGALVDAVHRVAFAQNQVEVALGIGGDGPRAVQGRARQGRAVRRGFAVADAGEGGDYAGGEIHPAYAVISDVADEQAAAAIERDAVRLAELRLGGRAAVAAKAWFARARDGGDDFGLGVHSHDGVVGHIHEEQVAGFVEAHLIGLLERGGQGRTAHACVTFLAAARHGGEDVGLQIQAAYTVIVDVAEIQGAVGPHGDAVRIVNLRLGGGAAVARKSGDAGARDGH